MEGRARHGRRTDGALTHKQSHGTNYGTVERIGAELDEQHLTGITLEQARDREELLGWTKQSKAIKQIKSRFCPHSVR